MKKIIIQNDTKYYRVAYKISKNKEALYEVSNSNIKSKRLFFRKNNISHRQCNLGPQYNYQKGVIYYMEKGKHHNLYGYAYINKNENQKEYWICDKKYTESKFNNYISIYNKLSYKRFY